MAITPGHQRALAPKPVSSTSSIETAATAQTDGGNEFNTIHPISSHQPLDSTIRSQETMYSFQAAPSFAARPTSIPLDPLPQTSLMRRPPQMQISPSTGVIVPSAVPTSNTVPEFLYQLTKMLTDNNRDIIEWSNGKIEVHNPHKLQTLVLSRYFRHSKFASFQRQLNYFGFRKLAGKGKMAPCSYVNDATTKELGSLLLIKRKAGNEPKSKSAKKDKEENSKTSSPNEVPKTTVNPVLANILYRSSTDTAEPLRSSQQLAGSNPPNSSQKAIARVAVGKGIRHNFSFPHMKKVATTTASTVPPALPASAPVASHASSAPVEASLTALKDNFESSLGPGSSASEAYGPSTVAPSNTYVPGSLKHDDSLVDLAMIPLIDDGDPSANAGMSFIDFPWQDPVFPLPDP